MHGKRIGCLHQGSASRNAFHNGKSVKEYRMSSSKRPPSCKENSLGTPDGLHMVCEKIGEREPLGMVFKGREPIGLRYDECSAKEREKNLITTRILRLQGLEEGLNKGEGIDTYDRYAPFMEPTMRKTWASRQVQVAFRYPMRMQLSCTTGFQ